VTVYVFCGTARKYESTFGWENGTKLFKTNFFKQNIQAQFFLILIYIGTKLSPPPTLCTKGKYELRPAFKKSYYLRLKVSTSRVTVASRVVNPKHDGLRPAVSKEFHHLHRKIGVYKMSNNWKVLTQFDCTLLYTQSYAHIQNCWMTSATQFLYHVTV